VTELRAGSFFTEGFAIVRSGIRWLRDEGHNCNVAVRAGTEHAPFLDEWRDLQIVFLSSGNGRLRKADVSQGGFFDRHQHHNFWKTDFSIGTLELRAGEKPLTAAAGGPMPLLFLAGRRFTELADVRSGLLSGWFQRARMWRGDVHGPFTTLLSLGICEQAGIFRGEYDAFLELAQMVSPSTHVVWAADDALVPSARVLVEQLDRTPEERHAIEADASSALAKISPAPSGGAWLFAGSVLSGLASSPLDESYDLLTRIEIVQAPHPDIVVLSLNAEFAVAFRHRRLGYTLTIHGFRLDELEPAIKAWLKSDFEVVRYTVEEIRSDYYALIDRVRARYQATFVIINAFSTSIGETIFNYAAFDQPMSDVVGSIRAKELNLMLHDLARDRGVIVVDSDALVAMLGAQHHLRDGFHQSGYVQALLREQMARIINERIAV